MLLRMENASSQNTVVARVLNAPQYRQQPFILRMNETRAVDEYSPIVICSTEPTKVAEIKKGF